MNTISQVTDNIINDALQSALEWEKCAAACTNPVAREHSLERATYWLLHALWAETMKG